MSKSVICVKKRVLPILLWFFLSAAILLPVRAEELLLLEEEDVPSSDHTVLSIAKVNTLPPDIPGVTFRGTVVWAEEETAIVQDGDDSIWVSVPETLSPGNVVLVSGQTGQEVFLAEDVTVEGTGPLPAMETTLPEAPEGVRVALRRCALSAGILTQNGYSVELSSDEPCEGTADVYGVLFDGVFCADTIVAVEKPHREWTAYFGLLDAHSSLSDGLGSVQEAFSQASRVEGLDFFAVTDHSGSLDSAKWASGKQAAAAVTSDHFVGIFGYEMTWGEDKMVGHINTFGTKGWLTPNQPGMGTLAGYCTALAKLPGQVSQFNHPGIYLGDFGGFRDYDPSCDAGVQLLQVEGEGSESFYSYYIQALDCGWHVAPTVGQDNHHGNWGTDGLSRTAVLAQSLSENALYEAMAARRVYATQDADLYIDYRLNGNLMGTVMGITEGLEASVILDDPTDGPEALVEVIGTGGAVLASGYMADGALTLPLPDGFPYYFLRVTQPDGDVAVTAPVWVDDYTDMGIEDFTSDTDTPIAGQEVALMLELYNREEIPLEVTGVSLYRDGEKLGDFTAAGNLRYTFPLLWEHPGELRLTVVVLGAVNGAERSYEAELTLGFGAPNPVAASIRQARDGNPCTAFAIEGYATSGNTNPDTTFPDTIYVQDNTGGIPVRGDFPRTIQVGTPMAVTGILREEWGERYLELTDCAIPDRAMYRYTPQVLSCREAMDYALRGGSLVQTEGTVVSVTSSGKAVSRFTLRDSQGNEAEIVIDPEIRSGAYGVNELAEVVQPGETVRAIGLLSREETSQPVLRVRNCDEVVAVPAVPVPVTVTTPVPPAASGIPDDSNPPTGDCPIWFLFADFLW